jgi:two-component system chemotaxis response regulator CheY
MKILIVDDEPASREILKKMVASHGAHQITLAQSGDEAWTYLDDPKRVFDLVFLDISMPGMDGLQLLGRIRQSPLHRAVRVVMCTASADRGTVARAIQLGTQHYLVKPCTEAAVVAKLKQIESILATS